MLNRNRIMRRCTNYIFETFLQFWESFSSYATTLKTRSDAEVDAFERSEIALKHKFHHFEIFNNYSNENKIYWLVGNISVDGV